MVTESLYWRQFNFIQGNNPRIVKDFENKTFIPKFDTMFVQFVGYHSKQFLSKFVETSSIDIIRVLSELVYP